MTVPAPFGDEVIRVFGAGVRTQELLLAVAVIVMLAFDRIMNGSMLGRAMRAVAANPAVANLMGINVNAVMIGAFFASSALAGLASFLVAPITSASIFMGLAIGLKGFSGAMIGGLTNPRGCVLGGFVLGLLESYVNLWQSQWREVAIFALVILVLAVRPTGLFGKRLVEGMTRRGQTLATLAVAAALAACAALVDNDYYLRILFMSCVYYLCAAGVNVLVGYAGQKSLGQAGLFAAGAYTAALLTSRWQVDPWLALAAAPVVAGVFGVLIALPSLRVKGPTWRW